MLKYDVRYVDEKNVVTSLVSKDEILYNGSKTPVQKKELFPKQRIDFYFYEP